MRGSAEHSLRILAHQYRELAAKCRLAGETQDEAMHLRTAKLFQDELDRMGASEPATPRDPFEGFREPQSR